MKKISILIRLKSTSQINVVCDNLSSIMNLKEISSYNYL